MFRIVGGTDHVSPTASHVSNQTESFQETRSIGERPKTLSTTTGENRRLRNQRRVTWCKAAAAARYWEARLEFDLAVWCAQDRGVPEGKLHPPIALESRCTLLAKHREAVVKRLLTPAPDLAAVKWKQTTLAKGRYLSADAKTDENIKSAIAKDLAFLDSHPMRRSLSISHDRRS
jgi:hypothetical protein